MASIVVAKPSLRRCHFSLRNPQRSLLQRRPQELQSMHKNFTPALARGSASTVFVRGSIAPKAVLMPASTSLIASISASASTSPAHALSPAVLSWAFALATIHAAALVLLVK